MDETFWQQRWRDNKTSFHEGRPNALLTAEFRRLALRSDGRVFVPLCGKSGDLDWLLAQGCRVAGIEFNRSAVEAAFERLRLRPDVTVDIAGPSRLIRYESGALTLFAGDFFDLTAELLGPVDAVYDRAALVALPQDRRPEYARHLTAITDGAPQLLITYEYDQTQMDGPPFSVDAAETARLYDRSHLPERLISRPISGPLAQRCDGSETAWLLAQRTAER